MSGDFKSLIKSSQAVLSKACHLLFAQKSQHVSFRAMRQPASYKCFLGFKIAHQCIMPNGFARMLAYLASLGQHSGHSSPWLH